MVTEHQIFRKIDHLLHPGIGEIWMLHRVVDVKSPIAYYHRWEITPRYLEQLIETYLNEGYQFVSIDQVCQCLAGAIHLPKFVCITLDDGHLDNYTTALPIFEKYQVPFCIYVTPGYIEEKVPPREDEVIPMMTREQVIELSRNPLCTIGNHTMTHPHLNFLSKEEQRKEIIGAKQVLEQWIGKPVLHFASPYGDYDDITCSIVKSLSLLSHVVVEGGLVRKKMKRYKLPRKEILNL